MAGHIFYGFAVSVDGYIANAKGAIGQSVTLLRFRPARKS